MNKVSTREDTSCVYYHIKGQAKEYGNSHKNKKHNKRWLQQYNLCKYIKRCFDFLAALLARNSQPFIIDNFINCKNKTG